LPDHVGEEVAATVELLTGRIELCRGSETRLAMAEEAWCYARKHFDTKQYCRQLLDFIDYARLNRPILDLVDHMSDRLLEMPASSESAELVEMLEREICRLAAID